jgi:hypothetical protein
MRLTATISSYEQRHPAPTVGIDAFCRSLFLVRAHPVRPPAPDEPRNRSPRTQLARPSGRQDSNLRPLVPQTSPYFPPRAEFDLECFRREMVGMRTRARIGIRWNRVDIHSGQLGVPHLPSSPLFSYLELGRSVTRPPRAHGMTVAGRFIRFGPPRRRERKTGLEPAASTLGR